MNSTTNQATNTTMQSSANSTTNQARHHAMQNQAHSAQTRASSKNQHVKTAEEPQLMHKRTTMQNQKTYPTFAQRREFPLSALTSAVTLALAFASPAVAQAQAQTQAISTQAQGLSTQAQAQAQAQTQAQALSTQAQAQAISTQATAAANALITTSASTAQSAQQATTTAQSTQQASAAQQQPANTHITLNTTQPVRLEALLDYAIANYANSHDIYWPQARLIDNNRANEAEALRANVRTQLTRIGREHPEIAEALLAQINSWPLGYQPYSTINRFDARVSLDNNPLLPAGSYTLILPQRPTTVSVFGFTAQPGEYAAPVGSTVRHFMSQVLPNSAPLAPSNHAHATSTSTSTSTSTQTNATSTSNPTLTSAGSQEHVLLQRNAESAKLPWAAYNAGSHHVLPGDMLFIGPREASAWGLMPVGKLKGALPQQEIRELEANVQALMRHVMPQQVQNINAQAQQAQSQQTHQAQNSAQTQSAQSQQASNTQAQQASNTQAQQAQQTQPQHSWQSIIRPHQLHRTNWELQNRGTIPPQNIQPQNANNASNNANNASNASNNTHNNQTPQTRRYTYNNYGHLGLIQMPNARHAPAGEFTLAYNDMNEYYRYTVSVQLYDWVQASAFYLRLPNRLYSNDPNFSGDSIYTDKGFDVKFRLLKESRYLPEVSVGLIDVAGTGIVSSEYVAASKAFGPLDFTLGLGFGRMGSADHIKNPLCHLADTFCQRPSGTSGSGGKFEYDQWFRGNTGIFAGVEYQTPIDNLRLKLEYESNDYSQDRAGIAIDPRTPINIGLNWRLNNVFDISLGYERGDTLTFGINLRTNYNSMQGLNRMPPKREPVLAELGQQPRYPQLEEVNWQSLGGNLRAQRTYTYSEFYTSSTNPSTSNSETPNRVTVYTHPTRLRNPEERLDRAARVLLAELPTSISEIEIVEQASRQPIVAYRFNADEYRLRIANADPDVSPAQAWQHIERVEPTPRPTEIAATNSQGEGWQLLYPNVTGRPSWGFLPQLTQGYGSPETFLFYQLQAQLFSHWQVNRHLNLHGAVGVNILNNYDKFTFTTDSNQTDVPRVRTYAREYMQADVWVNRLQASYYKALSSEWHAVAYGGYLERMFAGVGGEVLYRPLSGAVSYGLDINRVRQRDFNGGFGLRDYEVTTGFASLYYDVGQHVPFMEGGLITMNVGRFLAGDKGVNISYQRRFDSGVVLGAFAAFTDMSTADFGEGSFNKGFFISIPFDLFTINPSRERIGFGWSPLTRDGGTMLNRRNQLWHLTDERSPYFNR